MKREKQKDEKRKNNRMARAERRKENSLWSVAAEVISRSKKLTAGLVLTVTGSILFALLPPLVLERIVNALSGGFGIAGKLALFYFGMLVISGLLDSAREILITVTGQKITHGLRSRMCEKLSRLPASYFVQNEEGKIASRMVGDVNTVESLFTNGVISMFVDVCRVVSIVAVIFVKSAGLGVILLIVTPLLYALTRTFQKRMRRAQLDNRAATAKVNTHIPETIRNIRTIRTLFVYRYMEKRYDEAIQESYGAMEKANLYDSIYSPIIVWISSLIIAVMMVGCASGGTMQRFFGMSVGTAVAVIAYVGKVFDPLESIGMEIQNIQSAAAGIHRINELLNEEERPAADRMVAEYQGKIGEPCVIFRDVTFGYREDQEILQQVSFAVNMGEHVTLAGRTGAGKSTIFRLLLGLYEPRQGSVTVFGKSSGRISDQERRKIFGCVEQAFRLVSGSIGEQISLFDPEITQEQIEDAARLVGLHEFIRSLENGYDTKADAGLFSQGQLQLLSIARAVVLNPPVLLLDEITANLDSATEQRVLAALNRAARNRTVISISHRLYEQDDSNRIIQIG